MITKIEITDKYLSLTPYIWDCIPRFAVLTGITGVGKTQLLKLINETIKQRNSPKKAKLTFLNDRPIEPKELYFANIHWPQSGINEADSSGINNRNNKLLENNLLEA